MFSWESALKKYNSSDHLSFHKFGNENSVLWVLCVWNILRHRIGKGNSQVGRGVLSSKRNEQGSLDTYVPESACSLEDGLGKEIMGRVFFHIKM